MQSVCGTGAADTGLLQQNSKAQGKEAFVWTKHWYPLMLVVDLDSQKPTPHTLLNIDMVIWKDGQGNWAAAEDRCPHRFVICACT